ncbi:MAG: hypothetical protein AB8B56_21885 [Crocinitomicaceae bacterium]
MNDKLIFGDITYYAGKVDDSPVVFSLKNDDCSTAEYIVSPSINSDENYAYDHFASKGRRIAVEYVYSSAGTVSSEEFLFSLDGGVTWESIKLEALCKLCEGIQSIEFENEKTIRVKVHNLESPFEFISYNNGSSWNIVK